MKNATRFQKGINDNKIMDINEFGKLYEQYMDTKRDEMKKKYNRVLPSGELVFNRYEKAKYLNYGEGTSVYDTSVVMGDVEIGKNTWIGPYTLLEGLNAKLTIGDNVAISSGVLIYTHKYNSDTVSRSYTFCHRFLLYPNHILY